MPKVPKIRSLHIFATYPENEGDKVDFLPADKQERVQQVESITLVLCS